jgi:hypothetical protein
MRETATHYALNPSEENSFLGVPLVVAVLALVWWLWRYSLARTAIVVGAIFALCSLGREIVIRHHHTGVPGPYRLLAKLPLFNLSLPSRYALVVIPMIGILLAMAIEHADDLGGLRRISRGRPPQWVMAGALLLALLPVAPTPLAVRPAPTVPDFIASGAWRAYLAGGGTLVPVPLPNGEDWGASAQRWSTATGLELPMPGGYFLGPVDAQGTAGFTAPPRPTSDLFAQVAGRGVLPEIGAQERVDAVQDLRYWHAAILVLGAAQHEGLLRETVDALLGPPRRVDDVWLWDVRGLTGIPGSVGG